MEETNFIKKGLLYEEKKYKEQKEHKRKLEEESKNKWESDLKIIQQAISEISELSDCKCYLNKNGRMIIFSEKAQLEVILGSADFGSSFRVCKEDMCTWDCIADQIFGDKHYRHSTITKEDINNFLFDFGQYLYAKNIISEIK